MAAFCGWQQYSSYSLPITAKLLQFAGHKQHYRIITSLLTAGAITIGYWVHRIHTSHVGVRYPAALIGIRPCSCRGVVDTLWMLNETCSHTAGKTPGNTILGDHSYSDERRKIRESRFRAIHERNTGDHTEADCFTDYLRFFFNKAAAALHACPSCFLSVVNLSCTPCPQWISQWWTPNMVSGGMSVLCCGTYGHVASSTWCLKMRENREEQNFRSYIFSPLKLFDPPVLLPVYLVDRYNQHRNFWRWSENRAVTGKPRDAAVNFDWYGIIRVCTLHADTRRNTLLEFVSNNWGVWTVNTNSFLFVPEVKKTSSLSVSLSDLDRLLVSYLLNVCSAKHNSGACHSSSHVNDFALPIYIPRRRPPLRVTALLRKKHSKGLILDII